MIPDNVTLIVKAPNQQIEDQNVECQSSWTVKELKGHLAEVYPSKPRPEEQKIIYSGQLLKDNIILKDILRTYESQIAHTMHLVCAPNRRMPEIVRPAPAQEGLRRRIDPETPRPEMRQNDQNHTVEMQNYLSSFVNNYGRVPPYPNMGEGYLPVANDPTAMANQMMMMQQAYLQYMQQYANMWQANQQAAPTVPTEPPRPQQPPEVPQEDNEEAGRDWLDHIYAASRLAILSSLVYLYGSGARLLLVLVLVVAGYLHQIGFFRDLNLNQRNQRVNQPADNANQAENVNQRADNGNPPADNGNQAGDNVNARPNNENRVADNINQGADNVNQPADNINQPADNINQPLADNQQSLLAVTWMIFSTFFASLIPDVNQ